MTKAPSDAKHERVNTEFLDQEALAAHPQFASTLASGLAVLGCFSEGALSLGNKEVAEMLGLTRPTVSRLMFTLMGLGYLRQDSQKGKYSLGPAVLSLGYPLLSQLTIRRLAAPEMLELARYARGPVSVGVRDRLQVVYVETVQGIDTNATRPDIGSTRPMLRTAMGRALLYALRPAEREQVLKRLEASQPQQWAEFSPAVADAQAQIEARGFCVVAGDWQPTLAAVGVPMRAHFNGMALAFNLTVPSYSTDQHQLERSLGPRLVALVRSIEYKLGIV